MDPLTQALVSAGPGGLIAATIFYFYRGKQTELDAANARIATLQDRIVNILQSQLESEPQRRETLAGLKRLVEDQSAALKAKVQ